MKPDLKIVSFHNGNIRPELITAQQRVFTHFGLDLQQSVSQLVHGEHINWWLHNNDWGVIALFDIDAACQDPGFLYHEAEKLAEGRLEILGGAQNANHNGGTKDYASPACCMFSRATWKTAGLGFDIQSGGTWTAPCTVEMMLDTGQAFSEKIRALGGKLTLLKPQSVQVPRWSLEDGSAFGLGTDYGPFYHAFESRFGTEGSSLFLQKCSDLVGGNCLPVTQI